MKLWIGFIRRFSSGIRTWKIWYACIFAVVGIAANCAPAVYPALATQNLSQWTVGTAVVSLGGLLYLIMSVLAIPILGWTFQKRIRSGRNQMGIPRFAQWRFSRKFRMMYALMRGVLFAVVIPALVLTLLGVVAAVDYFVSPDFASNQQAVSAVGQYWLGAGFAFLACLEELWRWAIIASVVYTIRWLFPLRWDGSSRLQGGAFILALIVSSFFFGLGHVAEFSSTFQIMALIVLGLTGLVLTGISILTRRLWVAMITHAVYDFLVMTNLISDAAPWIIVVALFGIIVVIPIVYRGYSRIRRWQY